METNVWLEQKEKSIQKPETVLHENIQQKEKVLMELKLIKLWNSPLSGFFYHCV